MAQKHISEDEIKFVISAESSAAQQELHKLSKETKDLASEERARKKAMVDLEAQGKKEEIGYKNLQKEAKNYSDKIKDNNKKIDELTRGLDLNALSMVQLKKQAKDLQRQLDNTSKAANPEAYAKTDKQLKQVNNRMSELRTSGNNVSKEFDLTSSVLSKLKIAAMAFITVKLGEYLGAILSRIYGVRKEFAMFGAVLSNALGSVPKAVTAMKMLQNLAQDTPASLQEWTESYIKLVNRGIKPTKDELINMGDVASSQGKTLDMFVEALLDAMTGENERLKEFGIRASKNGDTIKYTFKGVTTEVANTDEAIKNYILSLGKLEGVQGSMAVQMNELAGMESNLGDTMDNLYNKLGKRLEPFFKNMLTKASSFISDFTKAVEPLSDAFDSQLEKVVDLEVNMPSLLSRYDELKAKTKLSAVEQKELNVLIEQISKIVPGAVDGWDQYGRAISLSTVKVREFMTAERARLNFLNKEQLNSLRKQRNEAEAEMKRLEELNTKGRTWSGATAAQKTDDPNAGMRKLTSGEIQKNAAQIAELGNMLMGIDQQIKKLSGGDIDKVLQEQVATEKYASTARTNFLKLNQSQLKTWIDNERNASNRYMDIAKEVYESRQKTNGTTKKDTSDPNAAALKNLESSHDAEINEIRLTGREKQQAEYEIENTILNSDAVYYEKRIKALEGYKVKEKKLSKSTDYEKQIVDAKTKLLDIEVSKEKNAIDAIARLRDQQLEKEDTITKAQQVDLTNRLSSRDITQQKYEMMQLTITSSSAETRLAINEQYANDVADLELKNAKLKEDTVKAANKAVTDSEVAAATARAAQMQKLNDLTKDFKEQFKVTTVGEDLKYQLEVLDAAYKARKELAEKNNLDTTDLDKAYLSAKENLTNESEQRIQAIRQQYGLTTQKQDLDAQLVQLKSALDQQLLTQEEYEKAVQNTKRDSYKKQTDYYSSLFSGAVEALQQAEMDNVDAKYDVEIEAAKGNAEEIERLENEKAQKKLDIEKKYADVNFAVKASEIIANTAVAIMTALAQLGPIAGPIAAALMGITGVAQLASANAERQKVKNMTLSGSSSSSSSGSRVATGRESGGKVDVTREQDGKFFQAADYNPNARGYIDRPTVIVGEGPAGQSKEWVASNAAVMNPTVAPILEAIDKSQQAGTIRTLDLNNVIKARMAGYATGGNITQPTTTPNSVPTSSGYNMPKKMMEQLAKALIDINENGVSAPVVLSDLERKQALRNKARAIGRKK